jgi:Cys-rich protein (TIGR01571 family)
MRPEPSAPEITEVQVVATPSNSYSSGPATSTCGGAVQSKVLVGAWDAGFCSCLNFLVPNSFMALCCPWVSLAQITARLGIYPYAKTLLLVLALHVGSWVGFAMYVVHLRHYHHRRGDHDETTDEAMDPLTPEKLHAYMSEWRFLSVFCHALYGIAVWQLRTRVRERFQISGSRSWDAMAAGCCTCCTVAQIATHVKSYTPGSCDFGPPADVLPAFPSARSSHV